MKLSEQGTVWQHRKTRFVHVTSEVVKLEEVNKTLKAATERLSAADARYYGELSGITLIRDAMLAYATALEDNRSKGEVMMNTKEMEDKYYCGCTRPKINVVRDDRGDKVKYCKQCWKPIKEK